MVLGAGAGVRSTRRGPSCSSGPARRTLLARGLSPRIGSGVPSCRAEEESSCMPSTCAVTRLMCDSLVLVMPDCLSPAM